MHACPRQTAGPEAWVPGIGDVPPWAPCRGGSISVAGSGMAAPWGSDLRSGGGETTSPESQQKSAQCGPCREGRPPPRAGPSPIPVRPRPPSARHHCIPSGERRQAGPANRLLTARIPPRALAPGVAGAADHVHARGPRARPQVRAHNTHAGWREPRKTTNIWEFLPAAAHTEGEQTCLANEKRQAWTPGSRPRRDAEQPDTRRHLSPFLGVPELPALLSHTIVCFNVPPIPKTHKNTNPQRLPEGPRRLPTRGRDRVTPAGLEWLQDGHTVFPTHTSPSAFGEHTRVQGSQSTEGPGTEDTQKDSRLDRNSLAVKSLNLWTNTARAGRHPGQPRSPPRSCGCATAPERDSMRVQLPVHG